MHHPTMTKHQQQAAAYLLPQRWQMRGREAVSQPRVSNSSSARFPLQEKVTPENLYLGVRPPVGDGAAEELRQRPDLSLAGWCG